MTDQGFLSRRTVLSALGGLAALPALTRPGRAAAAVKIGYTTDTEQSILGNLAAIILEKKLNIPVKRVANLGGTGVAHEAIIDGAIDIYPDYTGDALANVLKMAPITDLARAWSAVHDAYLSKYKITWLNPTPADPVQAKMMWFMPLIFSAMFFAFPSGLVLYYLTNNMLSIAQQYVINKRLGVLNVK